MSIHARLLEEIGNRRNAAPRWEERLLLILAQGVEPGESSCERLMMLLTFVPEAACSLLNLKPSVRQPVESRHDYECS